MPRTRTIYICQDCGHEAHKWMGQCPGCDGWNTFAEEVQSSGMKARAPDRYSKRVRGGRRPERLSEVDMGDETRLVTGVTELDRVMGGGIMHSSLSLLAGAPGIGKSTLMTELAGYLPRQSVLYVTGEESLRQVKVRAERLGVEGDNLLLLAETNVEAIAAAVETSPPDVLVIDSIQTVFRPDISSAPGSVTQVRESASSLMQLTKAHDFPTFLVGHITKSGSIAGPRVLEHMVDTVLYFEGDRHHAYRILRAVKNRFGAANEIGVFEMRGTGLRQVDNPSEIFISERDFGVSGSTVVCAMEGTRPVLVEVQALVTPTSYGTPQRNATGFDYSRLQMLLGVLEKREGLRLSQHDVFVNAAGGVSLDEPAVDLGVILAVASSFRDVPAATDAVIIGEVGLGGEVRSVTQLMPRLKEAAKLGFKQAVAPRNSMEGVQAPAGLEVTGIRRLHEAIDLFV